MRILEMLAENARTPITHIAKDLGVSDVAVKKRLEKLERDGIIDGYTIIVDPRKLGFKSIAYVGINVEPGKILDVARAVSQREDVVYVALTSGDHDIMVEIWATDSNEMGSKLNEISKLDGVKDLYPAIVLDVIRRKRPFPETFVKSLKSQ
jgi:Lrp/AsnC family transcriptional regulator for asnA, asnC and gidA